MHRQKCFNLFYHAGPKKSSRVRPCGPRSGLIKVLDLRPDGG
nr:MAG TPA: hypothetical protein [Caudoviricetes sp.]